MHDDIRTCTAQRFRPFLCVFEEERFLRTGNRYALGSGLGIMAGCL